MRPHTFLPSFYFCPVECTKSAFVFGHAMGMHSLWPHTCVNARAQVKAQYLASNAHVWKIHKHSVLYHPRTDQTKEVVNKYRLVEGQQLECSAGASASLFCASFAETKTQFGCSFAGSFCVDKADVVLFDQKNYAHTMGRFKHSNLKFMISIATG